jgi:penicillin amidase
LKPLLLLLSVSPLFAVEVVSVPGLRQPVEVLRDRWGVPHIYAKTVDDLFFAQGYIAARDRLFQIDLWRRTAAGELSEILGPEAIARDTLARSVRYRGDMDAEWLSYGPDTKRIATAFTSGINAYIRSLKQLPVEFRIAGYAPSMWKPEDCISRVAGLLMTRNLRTEISRSLETRFFGVDAVKRYRVIDPPVNLAVPKGLDLDAIKPAILELYNEMVGGVRMEGSNNWVVDGTMTVTGKPLLASDPHRPVQIPSLRKTVHLVGPGWNVMGAGEPALPGVALGHNENVGFGFTIVGIDQQDLYVEKMDPANLNRYWYRGQWHSVEIEKQFLRVKGRAEPVPIELRYTVHGPILHQEGHSAVALKWVGTEPGTAGYLAALSLGQARNWKEFTAAAERYKVPSENLVYADTAGNIGWHATGLTPIRKNWTGLYPVPGEGNYEWTGFLPIRDLPKLYNPAAHWVATANHNILPPGYPHELSHEWAAPFRYLRVREMILEKKKFSVADFERMQQDVVSVPARRFQEVLKQWRGLKTPKEQLILDRMLKWDARLTAESVEALIYEVWMSEIPEDLYPGRMGQSAPLEIVLRTLESRNDRTALARSLNRTIEYLEEKFGHISQWRWGRMHQIHFRHPLGRGEFNRGPVPRPGDGNTVNATSGAGFTQTNGASYRHILDLSDWDKSVMTNVPGESGDPASPHYSDLLEPWSKGEYHPMPYSRKAVEAASVERIELRPGR